METSKGLSPALYDFIYNANNLALKVPDIDELKQLYDFTNGL